MHRSVQTKVRASILRGARAWFDMEQKDAAKAAGVSETTLLNAEREKRCSEKTWQLAMTYFESRSFRIIDDSFHGGAEISVAQLGSPAETFAAFSRFCMSYGKIEYLDVCAAGASSSSQLNGLLNGTSATGKAIVRMAGFLGTRGFAMAPHGNEVSIFLTTDSYSQPRADK